MYRESSKSEKTRTKKYIITQNITVSKYTQYKDCLIGNTIKNSYNSRFPVGKSSSICNVFVLNEHSLEVVSEFCAKGFNAGLLNNINPCIMHVVTNDFNGSTFEQMEGILDEPILLRTNYVNSVSKHNPYPIKEDETVYNRYITVIRQQQNMRAMPYNMLYRFGTITTMAPNKPKLIDEHKMIRNDFLKVLTTIETVFQTAIYYGHNLIVLTLFGHNEDNIPQEDVIKIYNSCIFKYGHNFKYVLVAIPPDEKKLFELYRDNIVKPQNITAKIDAKYKLEEIKLVEKKQSPKSDVNTVIQMMSKNPELLKQFQQYQSSNRNNN
jgi:hypothetical protein